MTNIPRDPAFDRTLSVLSDPYRFITKMCGRLGAKAFETRLLLRKTTCLQGAAAAELFYDETRFVRSDATPSFIRKTLLGVGGVQGLDGDEHRHRKAMFMALMTPERVRALGDLFAAEWRRAARGWATKKAIVFYDELHEPLTRAVCAWAGVPLADDEAPRRARELRALFDAAGSVGPRHLWSRLARKRVDRWAASIIQGVRLGRLDPAPETAAYAIAHHRERDGKVLPAEVAAVELVNVLRPTVATAVYITFVAHALHSYPRSGRFSDAEPGHVERFVQEVRRLYPFFPAVIARTREPFEWKGVAFPKARPVMLDLYGTDHDESRWPDPETFRPARFRNWDGNAFDFIPQGGGDHHEGHRCPGEWIVVELMKVATGLLAGPMRYEVPDQDLSIDFARLPALPRSGIIMHVLRMDD